MPLYMLDTNALSEVVRHPFGSVARRLGAVGSVNVAISVVVLAEIRFGLRKNPRPRIEAQLARVLESLNVLAFEQPADESYADIRAHLERAGTPIGANDLLIAAHALALGATLVTANTSEFARVPGLAVEDWRA